MGCRNDYPDETPALLDKLTRLLCESNKLIDGVPTNYVGSRSQELAEWWKEHQRLDAEREAKEKAELQRQQIRQKLLSTLSKEELDALGVRP